MPKVVKSPKQMSKNKRPISDPSFSNRHIGPSSEDLQSMLSTLSCETLEELGQKTVPEQILFDGLLNISPALNESDVLKSLRKFAQKNRPGTSYIGMGYYPSITPSVIQRNILENPGWYTQYTPYQAEISQGRLEALLNYQTMVCDLTGMELANSSLLDEATAAAEAMLMCFRMAKGEGETCFIDDRLHPQTIAVLKTRAKPLGIKLVIANAENTELSPEFFCAIVQYPNTDGVVQDYRKFSSACSLNQIHLVVASDLLALTLLETPASWGADIVVGSSQRLGVSLGYGGPHAGFFATKEEFKRFIPGRIVGVSKDRFGKIALRLALQVREQHIKRDRATSNICTAQVLLAIMASMYVVYHGPDGIQQIARRIHARARALKKALVQGGLEVLEGEFFDTIKFKVSEAELAAIKVRSENHEVHLRYFSSTEAGISIGETTSLSDLETLLQLILANNEQTSSCLRESYSDETSLFEEKDYFARRTPFMESEVFHRYHTETELLRYIHRLQGKDLSLTTSMIPLGSCTMKLNATTEMLAVTWPEFANMHPYIPEKFAAGYAEMIAELEADLAEITGFTAVSLQPNAGSQGEYAGLLAIQAWHESRGQTGRNICLIPESAHGTNPASAIMAGMKVKAVRCDEQGDIMLEDLREKIAEVKNDLAGLMVTYPSTHGVFEENIKEVCSLVHEAGGQVYMDGANLNAQVGLCRPAELGADVCHMNLHKTFCIPHGGGGPGIGPIAVAKHLQPFLPALNCEDSTAAVGLVAAAPYGSAGILPISWSYIKMMGPLGLKKASQVAILNANYIAKRLESSYPILYKGKNGFVAHECILDLRAFKRSSGVGVEDVAKRLMDFGFHAPTVSWPVVETLMVEPTESEAKVELDRFCDAMIAIRREIAEVEAGEVSKEDNVLKNAPHTARQVSSDSWPHSYSREKAAWPAEWLTEHKYWPPVARIDSAYGDRNLVCSCTAELK